LVVEDVRGDPELELRERLEEFARLRNYRFNEFKEPVILALLGKRVKYGDFYCPCKAKTVLENVCPCKETRDGDVEQNGKCSCRLFWKK
jgi:ferredoxin-thioredoxin reductase catalytic subunit